MYGRRHLIVLDPERQILDVLHAQEGLTGGSHRGLLAAQHRARCGRPIHLRHAPRLARNLVVGRVGCGIDGGSRNPVRHDVVGVPVLTVGVVRHNDLWAHFADDIDGCRHGCVKHRPVPVCPPERPRMVIC
jgi:hypothetical protein